MSNNKPKSGSGNLITPYAVAIFRGVKPGWRKIFLSDKFKHIFTRVFNALSDYLKQRGVTKELISRNGIDTYIRPKHTNILEAFKYCDPNNVIAFLIGQDPYPDQKDAEGLCFSVPTGTAKSVSMIFKALKKCGELDEIPEHSHLVGWAKQGILLLNRYLTRSPNIVKNDKGEVWIDGKGGSTKEHMHLFWEEFTNELVTYFTGTFLSQHINHKNHYLAFLLWGSEARKLIPYISRTPERAEVEILEWCHPANRIADNDPASFVNCDHFRRLNEALTKRGLAKINWNPDYNIGDILSDQFYLARKIGQLDTRNFPKYDDGTQTQENISIKSELAVLALPNPIVAAIDGGCIGNGSENAQASFGVHFPSKFGGKPNAIAQTKPCHINIFGIVSRKLCCLSSDYQIEYLEEETKPTNNRGELLALIHALLYIIKAHGSVVKPIIIITDSEYVLHLVNSRLWKYLSVDSELKQITLNHDLIIIIKQLLYKLAKIVPNNTSSESIKDIHNALIQPAGQENEKHPAEMNLTWGGLTMIHQRSHIREKKGGVDYEKYLCNDTADKLCNYALEHKCQGVKVELTYDE